MMILDILIGLGIVVVGVTCYWAGFNVGRLTSRK